MRFPLPVGLCCDERGQIVPDPDVQVQGAVRLVFETFKETGSAYAVAHHFAKQGLQFPKRSYGGVWAGKLIWGRLTHARVLGVLKNPSYAGVYAFGRYRSTKTITPDGEIRQAIKKAPIGSWLVDIKNHHEGYISWDEFLHNQQLLEANRTNGEETLLSGPAREGLTLLQGLLLCSVCGKRVSVRYKGNGGIYPMYGCNGHRRDGVSTTSCLSVRADLLDKAISKRVLEILQPSQFQIAVAALEELEHRDEATTKQWQMRIEQAEYEAQLAERRYSEVDPSNRLVAGTLERRWNDALLKLDELKQQLERFRQEHCRVLTTEQKDRALALAQDLPRLWAAPSTQAKDRKRMLRLLLKEVTVEKQRLQSQIVLHVRWQGGAVEDIRIDLIPPVYDQFRYSDEVVEKVRELAQHLNDEQIANALNQEGVRPSKGQRFTANAIRWIRYRRRIKGPQLKQAEELTVQDVAEMFGVGLHIVYDWIDNGTVQARKVNNGSPWWITIGKGKETEIFDWVANSGKIRKPRQALTSAEGSAL